VSEARLKRREAPLPKEVNTFLLNDTIVIALEPESEPALADVGTMCWLLNRAVVPAFLDGVLFRGAVVSGEFYVDQDSERKSAVLGPAVVDAADWYERTEWAGVHFTPTSSLRIENFLAQPGVWNRRESLMFKHPRVPIKQQIPAELFVLNWMNECAGKFVRSRGKRFAAKHMRSTRILEHSLNGTWMKIRKRTLEAP
jgi:hypothetical protein